METKFEQFIADIKSKALKVDKVIFAEKNNIYKYDFTNKNGLFEVRSLSKLITSLAVGCAIEEKLFTLETNILPFFDDIKITNIKNTMFLKNVKIKHLLTLTFGQEKGLLSEKWQKANPHVKNFLEYALNYDIKHKAGTYFCYTNVCNYLLSAIIQKITNRNFSNYVNEKLFKPMDIIDWKWTDSPEGICMGATGLQLALTDLFKFGKLLLQDGKFNERQIVPQNYIKKLKSPQVKREIVNYHYISPVFPKWEYGYNLWLTGNGNYFGDGTDGQFLMVVPYKEIIISITSNEPNMREIVNRTRILIN